LSLYQKGVYYMHIKLFNGLPKWIAYLIQNKKRKLKGVLLSQSFYSVNDLQDYCGTL
jgi:hypothetical protein